MFSEMLMALGLSFGLAATGASIPPIWYTTPLPSKVSVCSSRVIERLNIEYNDGVDHYFDIDFTQNQWNVTPYWSGDSLLFDGYFYIVEYANVAWNIGDDDDYFQSMTLNGVRLHRFLGSYDTEIRDYYPFPIAWQGYLSGQYAYVNGFDLVWRNVAINGFSAYYSTSWIDSRAYVVSRYSPSSGSSFGYSIDSVSDFATFRNNLESRVFTAWLAQDDSYSNGYGRGFDNGYSKGFGEGEDAGYQQGLDATGNSALAGSLFGSIIAIPFDVLNGLNEFMIWGIPIVSILITFLLVALIVAIIKRFV